MNRDERNEINIRYHQPLYSDSLSHVIFYGFIILVIAIILFIFGIIISNNEPTPPKPYYTNRYYNSSLDQNSMSYTPSLKTIK
jgi:hypothetical protein